MKAALKLPPTEGRNKLERDFGLFLLSQQQAGEILWYKYEPIRLKLGDGAWYKPDFGVLNADYSFTFYETKGHWREAARVRIKVAADLYPFFEFVAVRREKKMWTFEIFGRWK